MGATCFMSVILQSFVHNPLLRNFFLSDGHQTSSCAQEECLSCRLDDMFQDFYTQENTSGYCASNVLSASWHAQEAAFAGLVSNEEQDAHEYFQFLVEALHKTANTTNSTSSVTDQGDLSIKVRDGCTCIVHQTFYGKSQSTLACQTCANITTSIEPFLDLSLGLEAFVEKKSVPAQKGHKTGGFTGEVPVLTLERCLDEEYKLPETCEYTCHKCDAPRLATKQLRIMRLPNVLCIQLKVRKAPTRLHSTRPVI